ncbi:MAG TPA: tetratricopeptide repeat protein, partial [Gemmatimonadales bacterium]|jgi:tol-pal system protein YbgF|nr:tetratricopeptide repeat protein [Gemmatimonadales bacterium]
MSVSRLTALLLGAATALGGCATKSQVQQIVQTEMGIMRAQQGRVDSVRAAELRRIIALQNQILDSLQAGREALKLVRGELGQELLGVQQQLVQIQELTGQSQRRLAELRADLDNRSEQLAAADTTRTPAPVDTAAPAPVAGTPTPDQLYQGALSEFRRGSNATARAAFHEFVRLYPTHGQMPDALYHLAETFYEEPDSAVVYYQQVVDRFPQSNRAATSLYKLGALAEQRQDRAAARRYYQQVIQQFPRSTEANLARQKLASLRP